MSSRAPKIPRFPTGSPQAINVVSVVRTVPYRNLRGDFSSPVRVELVILPDGTQPETWWGAPVVRSGRRRRAAGRGGARMFHVEHAGGAERSGAGGVGVGDRGAGGRRRADVMGTT